LNRVNRFILIVISILLSSVVVYLYIRENTGQEPLEILAPLKIEVYRIDRHRLPDADIYLNQRFIGRTDESGIFRKDIWLIEGESYTLRIERDMGGYVYGPWETRFRVEEEEKERRPARESAPQQTPSSLEGEFDILTELERAQLGKASGYEKSTFLAILDGYQFYTVEVEGRDGLPIKGASVIVNGKQVGETNSRGVVGVRYTGEDRRHDNIKIIKEGEHIWMNDAQVYPDARVRVILSTMLLVELYSYTEYYDSVAGIENASVFMFGQYMGKTDSSGRCFFQYENENGVDGFLELSISYPEGFIPDQAKRVYQVKADLPKLTVVDFAYSDSPVSPKIAVMPITADDRKDPQLVKLAGSIRTGIEDYLSIGGVFETVPYRSTGELFRQFNNDFINGVGWKGIPLLKGEVDAVIYGSIGEENNIHEISLTVKYYTGEMILQMNRLVTLRGLQNFLEDFSEELKKIFPFEGNVTSINKLIYSNLGRRFGLNKGHKLYCYYNYFDDRKKDFAKKNVARLRVVDSGERISAAELESITEGYLLEPGVKVKRYRVTETEEELVKVTLHVSANKRNVTGANVYVEEFWRGQTNSEGKLELLFNKNADISLSVYKEGYLTEELSLKVTEQTETVEVGMQQGKTQLFIETIPSGALIYIDGVYQGTSPVLRKPLLVPYGYHLLEIELGGYKGYREYIDFNEKKVELTGESGIVLFRDLFQEAERLYDEGRIEDAIERLGSLYPGHPDYTKGLEFLGHIYLYGIGDYERAIDYYKRSLGEEGVGAIEPQNIITYYNLAQAYYSEAEKQFYNDVELAQLEYISAVRYLTIVHQYRTWISSQQRENVYLNTLFYLAVSYQKIYYLSEKEEYLSEAHYAWMNYFDFYDENLLEDMYFKRQYSIAKTYSEEVRRLRSER